METILVTGGAGFIGSNFVPYFLSGNPNCLVLNIDKLTYAGSLLYLREVKNHPRHQFIKGDICDKEFVDSIFQNYRISGVINFAAETHVDNSIKTPSEFILTNVVGTFHLLEACRRHQNIRYLQVSTDEVYGSLGNTGSFTESSPYNPSSPYSASKASADLLVRSYHKTYGLDVRITNGSNTFGPKQHNEKFIPTIIKNAVREVDIPIYGNGFNVRDWMFVQDHCEAILKVFEKGIPGENYNVAAGMEIRNIDLANKICNVLDRRIPRNPSHKSFLKFVEDRPGHDFRYSLETAKIQEEIGWIAKSDFDSALERTIDWYLANDWAL